MHSLILYLAPTMLQTLFSSRHKVVKKISTVSGTMYFLLRNRQCRNIQLRKNVSHCLKYYKGCRLGAVPETNGWRAWAIIFKIFQ